MFPVELNPGKITFVWIHLEAIHLLSFLLLYSIRRDAPRYFVPVVEKVKIVLH
jgi:hypothetical protein